MGGTNRTGRLILASEEIGCDAHILERMRAVLANLGRDLHASLGRLHLFAFRSSDAFSSIDEFTRTGARRLEWLARKASRRTR